MHRVLPHALAGHEPSTDRRAVGGFGNSSDSDPSRIGSSARSTQRRMGSDRKGRGRWTGGESVRSAFFGRSGRRGRSGTTLYFEHALLPHAPWTFPTLRSDVYHASSISPRASQATANRWQPIPPVVLTPLSSGIFCRSATRIARAGCCTPNLEATGLYDGALVIVTADHGVSFEPKGLMREVAPQNSPTSPACRYSSSIRVRVADGSMTGTRRRSTSSRRSRMSWASPSPGMSTECPFVIRLLQGAP